MADADAYRAKRMRRAGGTARAKRLRGIIRLAVRPRTAVDSVGGVFRTAIEQIVDGRNIVAGVETRFHLAAGASRSAVWLEYVC